MARKTGTLAEEVDRWISRCTRDGDCLMGPHRGYGDISFDGGTRMSAHRAVYIVRNGSIPDGYVIRHTCDRIGCVNPAHLITGTPADNARDASERDRLRKGEQHPNHTLSSRKVAAAVDEYRRGGKSQKALAEKYGVSQPTVGYWIRAEYRRDGNSDPIRLGKGNPILARGGLMPCGTRAAYARHRLRGTPVCAACREADRAYMQSYRTKRRQARQESIT